MEHTLTHRDGTQQDLQTKVNVSSIRKMEQSCVFMGEDKLTIDVVSACPIPITIGDRINVHGEPYTLNKMPTAQKTGERSFAYTLDMDGMQYQLLAAQFLLFDNITDDVVANPSQYTLTGLMLNSLTGTALDILKMLVLNANRVAGDGMWAVGVCPNNTDTLNFTLDRGTCLEALQKICEDWHLEFEITTDTDTRVNTIDLKAEPSSSQSPKYTFTFGKTGGLFSIERAPKGDDIVTRLYAFGGTQNIPSDYLAQSNTNRLCLRQQNDTRYRHLSYVENNGLKTLYGIREAVCTFDDIFPQRVGTVTGIVTTGTHPELKFRDSSMFDLNERDQTTQETLWLIPGTTAKVTFLTGQMAGYTFEIISYQHSSYLFTIKEVKEEGDIVLPSPENTTLRIATGDTYILTDIRMPDTYITAAEDTLRSRATSKLAEINADMYQYTVEVDSRWVKAHVGSWGRDANHPFVTGDFVGILDTDLGISVTRRLTKYTHDLLTDKYTLTLERYVARPRTRQTNYRNSIIIAERERRESRAVRTVEDAATTAQAAADSAMAAAKAAQYAADQAQADIDQYIKPTQPTP